MSKEKLISRATSHSETMSSPSHSVRQREEESWIFDELPQATVVSVSRPDTSDINALLLSYTIEFQYKQFKWSLVKKASQVLFLHFSLKKRAIMAEFHEKQEQFLMGNRKVKEWLHSLGIVDSTTVMQDEEEPEDGAIPVHNEDSVKIRNVPSRAALPIICPTLGGQQAIANAAKNAMQGYMNHFFGNLNIVNSPEVCKFMEVSKLSFLREYGPKLKEGYVMVKHLQNVPPREDSRMECCPCQWLGFCKNSWHKVWAVLKPGFLALLNDAFDNKLLDIIVFSELPASIGKEGSQAHLADDVKEHNPLRYTFKVSDGSRSLRIRTSSSGQVREWVDAINKTALRPLEGWCHPHCFDSFAPSRGLTEDGSQAQWFIDGQAAFEAIASAIESAKSEIFITGWWVCPELYLRRPFDNHFSSRLDSLLEAKAKGGVQIYLLIYKEVALALKINSAYSKKRLLNIHENVRVLRYPNHFSTGVYLWSHHEKLVIVDYKVSFIGGLDLCFGRYDTMEHKVGDYPSHIWPGKDYYNPRESEPNSWEDTMKDELDRTKYPRMPWHDVHCAVWGPACRDIARHFVQRWNFAKRNKAPNEEKIPLLIPHHHMVIPHYMGRSNQRGIKKNRAEEYHKPISRQNSFSSQSPVEDIPLLFPQEANGLAFPKLEPKLYRLEKDHDLPDQPNGFCHNDDLVSADSQSNAKKSVTQSGAETSAECFEDLVEQSHDVTAYCWGQVGPCTACQCQVIRSVSQWSAGTSQTEESIHSAYCSLIEKAKHFIYIENQFFISGLSGDEIIQNRILEALYRRIVRAYKEQKCFRVIVVLPLLPGFQGGVDDGGAATVRAIMHWQYRTISWEKTSILHNLKVLLGPKTNDYISFYGLRTHGRLFEGGPLATSQVYVHSKLMIIDDHVAMIGSSNINDRSLLGSRDSEIALVVDDKEFLQSSMNGQAWEAGKFAYSLRCSLWAEHLGLQAGEINQIEDPVSDKTYKDLWAATAKENTKIYQDVFSCIPNDDIDSRAALRHCMSYWKDKIGHTTIDLGIAEEKLESYESGNLKAIDPIERLKAIKGHLVSFPLNFMHQEDLRPGFIESEFYAAPQVFH